MQNYDFPQIAKDFLAQCTLHTITQDIALAPEAVGVRLVGEPIFGIAAADDPIFTEYQKPEAVGPYHRLPTDWLPEAKSVVSFFLPFSEAVRADNAKDFGGISKLWLHARIEGQKTVMALSAHLRDALTAQSDPSVCPALDSGFIAMKPHIGSEDYDLTYASNWSERHAAYACGLGTFGLSKGLITAKGVAGRFGSIITTAALPVTERPYTGLYDYCSQCGKCAKNCPVDAIDPATGKKHKPCGDYVDYTQSLYDPYYGCGKCQVKVPCECRVPTRIPAGIPAEPK